jgi:hypothetical protein
MPPTLKYLFRVAKTIPLAACCIPMDTCRAGSSLSPASSNPWRDLLRVADEPTRSSGPSTRAERQDRTLADLPGSLRHPERLAVPARSGQLRKPVLAAA